MNPTESSLSPKALVRILDVLERRTPISRRELAALASVSPSTASRAVEYLSRAGILGSDLRSTARPADLTLAPIAALPVFVLEQTHGTVCVLNARPALLGTASAELNPEQDAGEHLRLLSRHAMALLSGCAKASGLPAAAPILLTATANGQLTAQKELQEAVTDIMGVPPLAVVGEAAAISYALRWESLPPYASSLLYLRTGDRPAACFFSISETDAWAASPPKQTLGEALSRSLSREPSTAEGQRRGILRFIRDLNGFFPPELLLLEDPHGLFREGSAWREALPDGVEPILYKPLVHGVPLPVIGAVAYARRLLWEKMTGLSV